MDCNVVSFSGFFMNPLKRSVLNFSSFSKLTVTCNCAGFHAKVKDKFY